MLIRLIFCGQNLNKILKILTSDIPTDIRAIKISITPEKSYIVERQC